VAVPKAARLQRARFTEDEADEAEELKRSTMSVAVAPRISLVASRGIWVGAITKGR